MFNCFLKLVKLIDGLKCDLWASVLSAPLACLLTLAPTQSTNGTPCGREEAGEVWIIERTCQTKQMVSEMKDIRPAAVFNSGGRFFPFCCQMYCRCLVWRPNHEWIIKRMLNKEPLIFNRQETGSMLDFLFIFFDIYGYTRICFPDGRNIAHVCGLNMKLQPAAVCLIAQT